MKECTRAELITTACLVVLKREDHQDGSSITTSGIHNITSGLAGADGETFLTELCVEDDLGHYPVH